MKKMIGLVFLALSLFATTLSAQEKMTMTTTDGNTLHATKTPGGLIFDEYKGKIIFLEIYGHRCPYCLQVISYYNKLQEKYKDKLAIVSIELGGLDDNQLKAFDRQHGVNYDNITSQEAGELVPYISQKGGYIGMVPFLVVLDKSGNIQLTKSGPVSETEIEETIAKLSK